MEIFSKRYFLWIATAFLAFSAFAFFLKIEYVALLLLMLLIGLALIVVLNWEKRKMLFSLSVILIFAAFLGFFNSFNFASGQEAIKERYCGESYVCGYVNEVTRKGDFSSEYLVTIERIDGEEVSLSAILSSDYDAELRRGDFFEASATVLDIDECREELFISNKYDAPLVCRVSAEQGIIFTDPEVRTSLALKNVNRKLSAMLTTKISGVSGKLASALLLGNRELLPDGVLRDFRRAGVYHMLALSGMHVSILVGLFDLVMKKLYVKKMIRIILLAAMTLFYIALTGFLLSACRAMLMLFFFYLARILGKRADHMTSLFASVSLIVLISPQSVLDIGLILSFLSTFAIVVALEIKGKLDFFCREVKGGEVKRKLVYFARNTVFTVLASVCAMIATLPIMQTCFGEMSLVSVFSNLFIGIFVELLLVLSLGVLAFSKIALVSYFLARVAELVGEGTSDIVAWISEGRGVAVSLDYPMLNVAVWVLLTASLILLGMKLKRKVVLLIPTVVFAIFFAASAMLFNHARADSVAFEFVSDDGGDCALISSDEGFYVCDMSGGSYSSFYHARTLAKNNCFTEISGVVVTHYHTAHIASLERFCSEQMVRAVYLPIPANETEYERFGAIVRALARCGTEAFCYESGEELSLLGGALWVSDAVYASGRAHPSVAMSYSYGEDRVTVVENPFFGTYLEQSEDARRFVSESDDLIFGGQGNLPREPFEIFEMTRGVKEIYFVSREALALSDMDCDATSVFIDTEYVKHVLR